MYITQFINAAIDRHLGDFLMNLNEITVLFFKIYISVKFYFSWVNT